MRMIKTIVAMTAALAATVAHGGDSAPFLLDTVTISSSPTVDSLPVSWNATWVGGDMNATVVIADNGTEVWRTTGSGEFTYTPSTIGFHELTYTTYIGGVVQYETYSATFYHGSTAVDQGEWKYEVRNGGAVITKPGQTSGAVTIPSMIDGYPVRGIGDYAFASYSGLTSVTIPDSVTSIGSGAFIGCSSLTSVTIGNGVTSIGSGAFGFCSGLTSVRIPNSVTSIGSQAFLDCTGITSVTIPNNVTNIEHEAFRGCSGLRSVTVPQSVCSGSMSDIFGSMGQTTTITSVVILDGVTSIGNSAFSGCSGLTRVTIPNSVTSIGGQAFYGCGLTSVTIPDSVTSIGNSAFSGCSGLTRVTIGNGVKSIGNQAFGYCSLTSVTIPASVTSIGVSPFLGSVYLDISVAVDNAYYQSVNGILLSKDGKTLIQGRLDMNGEAMIPDGVTNIGAGAFEFSYNRMTSVTFPNSVTSIGDSAFHYCNWLTSVTIPDNVTSIGGGAFWDCSGLTSVTIGNGVTSIGEGAFWSCRGLTSVTIPSSVTSIGYWAFKGCEHLTSVTIPASVTSIGEDAFDYTALTTVHVAAGDTERVRNMISGSGYDVSGITFIEDVISGTVTPGSVDSGSVTPSYEVIDEKAIVEPYVAEKAVILMGVLSDGGKVVGIVELKLGKVNAKKGTSKVSGSVTTLDGKKHTVKAFNLEGIDGASPKAVTLEVKDFGTMSVTIGGTQFAGAMGKYHVQSANVGGDWSKGGTKVYVATSERLAGTLALPEGTIEELLPDGESVIPKNGKWSFAKAASVKWAKPKQGAALPERYDAESGKGLVVDTSGDKTNLSAMKLTYTPKKGTFKGSFKVYALEGVGKATKLKKYTVKVSGVVVGGVGYGTATCKKPAVSWSVTVR